MYANEVYKETFTIEDMIEVEGYHNPGVNWNGWARPYFTFEEAVKIAEWSNKMNARCEDGFASFIVDHEQKRIAITEQEETWEIGTVSRRIIGGDFEMVTLYEVGTGWWIWSIKE
jgi:hypothetical protein